MHHALWFVVHTLCFVVLTLEPTTLLWPDRAFAQSPPRDGVAKPIHPEEPVRAILQERENERRALDQRLDVLTVTVVNRVLRSVPFDALLMRDCHHAASPSHPHSVIARPTFRRDSPLHFTHTHAMKVVFLSGTYIQAPEGTASLWRYAAAQQKVPAANHLAPIAPQGG